jgi:hypothetical protein
MFNESYRQMRAHLNERFLEFKLLVQGYEFQVSAPNLLSILGPHSSASFSWRELRQCIQKLSWERETCSARLLACEFRHRPRCLFFSRRDAAGTRSGDGLRPDRPPEAAPELREGFL